MNKNSHRAKTINKDKITSKPKLPGLGMDPLNLANKKKTEENVGQVH